MSSEFVDKLSEISAKLSNACALSELLSIALEGSLAERKLAVCGVYSLGDSLKMCNDDLNTLVLMAMCAEKRVSA